jgi:hypothetical protein
LFRPSKQPHLSRNPNGDKDIEVMTMKQTVNTKDSQLDTAILPRIDDRSRNIVHIFNDVGRGAEVFERSGQMRQTAIGEKLALSADVLGQQKSLQR